MAEQHDDGKLVAVHTRDVGSSSASSTTREVLQEYEEALWETGVSARFPWLGIGALVGVIISAGAAALVLALCNGRAQSTWPKKITPNVILAGINAFANIMLAIAIGQGVAIAWWRKVMRGATVTDLHHSWGFSTSIVSLVKGWKYLNFIALAALAAKLAIIDSILLQRALQTYLALDPARNVTILAPLTTTWSSSGIIADSGQEVSSIRVDFQNNYVNTWNGGGSSTVSQSSFSGCDGTCQGTFEGTGFAFTNIVNPDPEQLNLTDAKWQNGTNVPLFNVSFEMSWANDTKNYSSILANMMWFSADTPTGDAPTGDCTGSRNSATMEIRPALLDIDFTYEDFSKLNPTGTSPPTYNIGNRLGLCDTCSNTQVLHQFNAAGNQMSPFTVKQYLDYPTDNGNIGNTTMGGVFLALQNYLSASANITYNTTAKSWILNQQGTLQLQQAADNGWDVTPGSCHYSYFINTELVVMDAINSLGFIYTNAAAFQASSSKNITATQQAVGIHYRTNFAFMGAAVASMVLCAFLVLPTYWKFWELGRPVSLAPVEIANAFRAPVLDSSKASNAMVDDLLVEVGDRKVMFGQMAQGRLGVEEMGKVKRVGTT